MIPVMSTTRPAGREVDTPRTSEARLRAVRRADRQSARLHLVLWVVMGLITVSVLQDRPRPGVTGVRLGITLALAGCLVPLIVAALSRAPGPPRASLVAVPLVLGVSGSVLAYLQPSGLMEIPVSAAVAMLFARLPPRSAFVLATPLTVAIAFITADTAFSHVSIQAGLAAALLCVTLGASYVFSRQARLGQDRTELLLAELEDSREAEARAAAVAERGRIARELHDVLAQSLSALAIQLEGARKLAERDDADPALRQLIARSGELTRTGLSDARQAVAALRGDELPTLDRLTALVNQCRRDLALPITLTVSGRPRALPPTENLALYRGAQEALTNVARYAPGSPTAVLLRYTPGATTLTVSDQGPAAAANGDGGAGGVIAPPAQAWTGGGNGLRGMRERIERVGGRTQAGPEGRGWTVEMEIPA